MTYIAELLQLDEYEDYYEYHVLVLLSMIFFNILRHAHIKTSVPAITSRRMDAFIKYIGQHYASSLTLDDIASSASVSKAECLRCFKKTLNQTPYAYLLELRLSKAAGLLVTSDQTITSIALNCGFNQVSQFGALFKRKTGLSPKQYRQKNRQSI